DLLRRSEELMPHRIEAEAAPSSAPSDARHARQPSEGCCSAAGLQSCVLELVDEHTFNPTQRETDFLRAVQQPPPQWVSGKRDQFARSILLDQLEPRLELLDVLGIIQAPSVGGACAPNVRARSLHNE